MIVDRAVELREGAEVLVTRRKETLIFGDLKHFAAHVLKRGIGGDPRWTLFTAQVGATRSLVQQTELGHLTPPRPRPKARFMNLGPTRKWARMAAWQLAHPNSKARSLITTERFTGKLGWLAEFAEDITRWNACQESSTPHSPSSTSTV